MSEEVKKDTTIKLDEKVVTDEQLKEYKEALPGNKKVVQVKENEFKTVQRLRG